MTGTIFQIFEHLQEGSWAEFVDQNELSWFIRWDQYSGFVIRDPITLEWNIAKMSPQFVGAEWTLFDYPRGLSIDPPTL